ncbi:hypothetical protein, partial [Bordetella bronchiseptica]
AMRDSARQRDLDRITVLVQGLRAGFSPLPLETLRRRQLALMRAVTAQIGARQLQGHVCPGLSKQDVRPAVEGSPQRFCAVLVSLLRRLRAKR